MPTDFADITADLRDLGGQRVWSLMISLFGDLARAEGQRIDGPVLSAIMSLLQVRPEASRVALHRLRKDGWITSSKSGRIRQHSLTAKGRAESAAASPRIYANPMAPDTGWQCLLLPESDMTGPSGFSRILPRLYIGPANLAVPAGALRLEGGPVPDWLLQEIQPSELAGAYTQLLETLQNLDHGLPSAADLSPTQIAVLRCLIVHNWRRLVLKHPALPAALIDPDSPAHLCHCRVHDLLSRYPRPTLSEIEQHQAAA